MSFWTTPDGQRALAARAMDRAPVYEAMQGDTRDYCFYCKAFTDDYRRIDFGTEIRNVCGPCWEVAA